MGVNLGKWQQILGEDRKVGERVMLSNMTSKQKFLLLQNIFCYHAKYSAFSLLLPKTGGGGQVPRMLCPCIGMSIWIILLFVLYEPDFGIWLPPIFSINLFILPGLFITTINTTNSKIKITRVIGRAIFLKNKK